jgi:PAS domain S-box-containing protein
MTTQAKSTSQLATHPHENVTVGWFSLCADAAGKPISMSSISSKAQAMLGLTIGDPAERLLDDLIAKVTPESARHLHKQWVHSIATQEPLHWYGHLNSSESQGWISLEMERTQADQWQGALIRSTTGSTTDADDKPIQNEAVQALSVTASIPVGTYVIEIDSEGKPSFQFMSDRWLQMLNLDRQTVQSDPLSAFRRVHPDDLEDFHEQNAIVFASGTRFYWEGRIVVNETTRWVSIESIPRTLANGHMAWEGVMIDISERIQAQQQLEQQRAELERVLNNIPVAIAINNLDIDDPEITFINDHFVRSLGYTRQQLQRVSDWTRLAYPDPVYREEVFHDWNTAMDRARAAQGSVEQAEYRVCAADGHELQLLISAVVLDDMTLIAMVDVSERRRIERELEDARSTLARTALEITEAIPVGTYTMVLRPGNPLASFSFMSERFLQLTGLERAAALEDPLKAFACVHPDDYNAWVQLNAEAFEKKQPFFGQTRVVVDGKVRWITAESIPRDLPEGSTVWEGVLIDVTERIHAQQKLEESRRHLENVLNNLPVAIAIQNLDPHDPEITFLNDHFIRSLGYTRNELKHVSDWARLAYPDPRYRAEVFQQWNASMARAMATQGTVEQAEFRVCTADRSERQVLINAIVLNDMALVALVDVTRIRTAEHQLMQSLQREKEQEELLRKEIEDKLRVSLAASAVAHEISQPLSAIRINSQLALRSLEETAPEASVLRALLNPIAAESQRINLIADRIRMLLRQVETNRELINLREVLDSASLLVQQAFLGAGASLTIEQSSAPCEAMGDAVQLQLALTNVLRNGLEAAIASGNPSPAVAVTLKRDCKFNTIIVNDNGIGFQEGFDFDRPLNNTKANGSGIGLYVARLSMENHGGCLRIGRSQLLGGASVELCIPLTGSQ